ncbi:MAG TPA: hypothetical protein VFF02_17335 [Anaeromyxobacteraceae bacterium]|nr:hypothetical protein [Anaeromyxobacteraceae bacterium]
MAKDETARDGLSGSRSLNLLVPLLGETVAPRFDLAREVLIARARKGRLTAEPRVVLLPGPSAEEICRLVLSERITHVVCGGIEDVHYQYLTWKKVQVVDRVIGNWEGALRLLLSSELRAGEVVPGPWSVAGRTP